MKRLIDDSPTTLFPYSLAIALAAFLIVSTTACDGTDDPDVDGDDQGNLTDPCDLRLTKTADDGDTPGGPIDYQLRVDNMGGTACNPPITVTDQLPPGITYSSNASSDWNCTTVQTSPDEIECTYQNGALPAGDSVDLDITVNVGDEACMASNCGEVQNGEGNDQGDPIDSTPDNNRDCADSQCKTADGCVDPPSGMVGWWTGDLTADDDSNANNHGALQNGAHYSTGQVLESFAFDGQDDHVEVPNDGSLNFAAGDQFTIDAWVYPDKSEDNVDTIVDKRGSTTSGANAGYALQLRSNTLIVRTQNGASGVTYSSSGSVPSHEWTHVTVTVDLANDTGTVYLDGSQDGTFSPSSTGAGDLTNPAPLFIGQNKDGEAQFDGRVDEVEVFERLLNPSEVAALAEAGPCGKCRVGCFEGTETYTAGTDDDFAGDNEPADTGPFFDQQNASFKDFDDGANNARFALTFSDLKPTAEYQYICGAELTIAMKPNGNYDYNDTIRLIPSDGSGNALADYGIHMGNDDGVSYYSWTDSLLSTNWHDPPVSSHEFDMDLANLTPSGSDPTNLIAQLNAGETLNVQVQDDTVVDYAALTVTYSCEPCEFMQEEPDMTVDKSLDGELQVGQTSTYTISAENVGGATASPPVEITDEIPSCMEIVGVAAPWDSQCSISGQTVTCTHDDPVPAGTTLQDIDVRVRPSADCGDLVENCATVSQDDDTNADNDESCVESEVSHERKQADVAIEKSLKKGPASHGSLVYGSNATYELEVTNNGPVAAQPPIEVTDDLPSCLNFVGAQPGSWSCSTSGGGQVTCEHNSPMPPNSSETLTLEVEVTKECGDLVDNCAEVTADSPADPDMSNNESCQQNEVRGARSDLTVDKKALGGANGVLDGYELTVTNNGPDADPGPIKVTDNLNACLEYQGASGSNWSCNFNSPVVTCTHSGPLAAGSSSTVTLQVAPSRACGDKLQNCAKVKSTTDTDTTNNEACINSPVFSL